MWRRTCDDLDRKVNTATADTTSQGTSIYLYLDKQKYNIFGYDIYVIRVCIAFY